MFSWIFQHYILLLRLTFRANTYWNLGGDDYFPRCHVVKELQSIAFKDPWVGFLNGSVNGAQSLQLPPALLKPALVDLGSPPF